jgi:hypothetical protein
MADESKLGACSVGCVQRVLLHLLCSSLSL